MASPPRRTSAHAQKPQRPASAVFKPRFPLDPFAAAGVREPWFIRPEALPTSSTNPRRDVLLVLGSPSAKDLDALLSSKHLANSLLVIATHQPPTIPHTTLPTVRILKLNEPLALEQAGAVRFVNVLEWAERVARLWRKYGGYGAVELTEDSDGQEHLLPPTFWRFKGSRSVPPSPRASASNLSSLRGSTYSVSLTPDGEHPPSRPRSLSSRLLSRARQTSLPAIDPSQRPFDALVNFLPKDVPDKALLKQAILVTTISRPFLIATARGLVRSAGNSQSSTSVYLPPTPPFHSGESLSSLMVMPTHAHLIHVLPVETRSFDSFARSKLVQSLESFLLSFGYPTKHDRKDTADDSERPRPYIMTSTSLSDTINSGEAASAPLSPYGSWTSDCSLVELVLCGCLDGNNPSSAQHNPKGAVPTGLQVLAQIPPRALLSRASDVVVLSEDAPTPPTVTVSQSEPGYHTGSLSPSLPPSSASHRQFPRHSSGSSIPSPFCSASPMRSSGPSSPLAKKDEHASLYHSLPTPPDSDESGPENGVTDLTFSTEPSEKHPVVTVLDHSSAVKSKQPRWKFWKRSASDRVVS